MKKPLIILVASGLLLAACGDNKAQTSPVKPANEVEEVTPPSDNETEVTKEESTMENTFLKIEGAVVKKNDNESWTVTKADNDEQVHMKTHDKTVIYNTSGKKLDVEAIDADAKITMYVDSKKPMNLMYPPQYSVDVIIVSVDSEPNFVDVAHFDKSLTNDTNTLTLNEGDRTEIINEAEEVLNWSDVKGANAIVFYQATTRSLPPQTAPSKVIVLQNVLEF